MNSFVLNTPFPISANRLWRRYGKRIVLSPEYRSWKIEAECSYMAQKKEVTGIKGHFTYHIVLDKRRRAVARDGDNRTKSLLDFIQRMDLIEDDKLADSGSWEWGNTDGAIITVRAA